MRDKILDLLKQNNFVSGEQIASNLNVSRTTIWKHIRKLRQMGYTIKSVKNRGYKLVSTPDIPIPEEVKKGINTKLIGRKILYFKTLPSTNEYAKTLLNKDILEGTVVTADVQTQGRGRKNREWLSPEGGLWFSVLLFPNISPQRSMYLTMVASVAMAQTIHETIGLKTRIKWPNDLLINGKKVCGILTQLEAELDQISHAIIGIGLNVNNDLDNSLKNLATTLKNEHGSYVSRVEILQSFINNFDVNYKKLLLNDFKDIRKSWFSFSDILDKKVRITTNEKSVEGIVTDVDMEGCLILNTNHGSKKFLSGDIEFL